MSRAKEGDQVSIHFTGRLKDGTVFDTSEGREPLQFEAGTERMMPGLSKAVIGMEEGEERTITVPPEEGFGQYRPGMQQEISKAELPPDVKVGDALQAQTGEGVIHVWVKSMGDESAVLDANHPLAGHEMEFDLKVVSVESAGE